MTEHPVDPDIPAPTPSDARTEGSDDLPQAELGPSLIGVQVGSFSIRRFIGSGGMGNVYEAMQDRPRRRVAVKMMKRGITSKTAMRRFEFEAQLLGRLKHSGIAQVYEAGSYDDGSGAVPYFAMEYIANAKSLTKYANDKKLGTRARLELFARICDAVQHGHLKGIVHRDLKPGNILVDSDGQPKIIDFGVARSTDSDMAVTMLQTDVGQLVGTLQYMSPEQVEADPSDIDVRSDVYALGVVLYEFLTGKPPYDVRQAAIHEAVRMVREDEPTRLSTIDRHLRGDIETIALKALQKERDQRYQSASSMREDILHYLHDEPISAKPPGAFEYLRRFVKRYRAAAAALMVILVVLVVAVISVSIYAIDSETQREAAVKARAELEQVNIELAAAVEEAIKAKEIAVNKQIAAEELADAAINFLRRILDEEGSRLLFMALGPDVIDGLLTHAVNQARREFSDETLVPQQRVLISVLQQVGGLYLGMSSWEGNSPENIEYLQSKATSFFRDALQRARRTLGKDDPDTFTACSSMGNILLRQGNPDEAEPFVLEALEDRKRVLGSDHPRTKVSLSSMGYLLALQERYPEAEVLLRNALTDGSGVMVKVDNATLSLYGTLAKVQFRQGKFEEAKQYLSEVALFQWDDADVLNNIAWETVTAIPGTGSNPIISDELLRISTRSCELLDYKDSNSLDTLARVYLERGEIREAIRYLRQAAVFAEGEVQMEMLDKLAALCADHPEAAGHEGKPADE